MKKIKYLFLCFICLLLVGCASKDSKEVGTLEAFKESCTNNGLEAKDKLEDYQQQNVDYITGSILSTLDDLTIEMVIYDSIDTASKIQKQHIASFINMKSSAATTNNSKGKNYYRFSMISNGYYMVSSRIDNTLIFSKTPLANKEKVEAILNDMNY